MHQLLKRASQFASKGKGALAHFSVVLLDAGGQTVSATDGGCGVILQGETGNTTNRPVAIPVALATAAAKAGVVTMRQIGPVVELLLEDGSRFATTPTDAIIPEIAKPPLGLQYWAPLEDWPALELAAIAALKPGAKIHGIERPDLSCVRVCSSGIWATDGARILHVETGLHSLSLEIPLEMFKSTPKGIPFYTLANGKLWLAWPGELRWCPQKIGQNQQRRDLREYLAYEWTGPTVALAPKPLRDFVAAGVALSDTKTVELRFAPDGLSVYSTGANADYLGSVGVPTGNFIEGSIAIDGDFFSKFLKGLLVWWESDTENNVGDLVVTLGLDDSLWCRAAKVRLGIWKRL